MSYFSIYSTLIDQSICTLKLNIATNSLPNGLHENLPIHTAKITYTSGSTGAPKGVCLSAHAQWQVANAIQHAAQLTAQTQHLCVLPLATLLENVAGVYATLLAGGTAHLLPTAQIGFNGNQINIEQLIQTLNATKANTAIVIPALLSALVLAFEAGENKATSKSLPHLRFLAVGGAHVSPQLLQRAATLGLPVFEGYGLSECASVVALNTIKLNKIGSVGKVLSHVHIKLASDGEILIKGAQFLGYTGSQYSSIQNIGSQYANNQYAQQDWLATGDIGYLDDNDFLHVNGRKKNMFITSFGRNISPEWLETTLCEQREILQACVFGEAKPFNMAIVVSNCNVLEVINAINQANNSLPDYAQIKNWLIAPAFSLQNGQLTANGRLKRDVIWQTYQAKIEAAYINEASMKQG